MEVVDREREISIQGIIFFLVFSYCFNLVTLIDWFGFPSMPKREIVENRLKNPIKEGDYKERLLRTYKYASIIIL